MVNLSDFGILLEPKQPIGSATIIPKKPIIADGDPLPSVMGRDLKVDINTVGIDKMALYVKKHNSSLSSVKCVATKDQVFIDFDIDGSKWTPGTQPFPILVRLFDENGQHLKNFTTAEGFTVFSKTFDIFDGIYQRTLRSGQKPESHQIYKCVLLKAKGNRLVYTVNIRDLRDASMVEIGFTER